MKRPLTPAELVDYNHCLTLVESFFADARKAQQWMHADNPMLGDFSPVEMIKRGRTARLVQFIRMAEEERS